LRWLPDIYGNSIAVIDFQKASRKLSILSEVDADLYYDNPIECLIEPTARLFPFHYAPDEQIELIPYRLASYPYDTPAFAGGIFRALPGPCGPLVPGPRTTPRTTAESEPPPVGAPALVVLLCATSFTRGLEPSAALIRASDVASAVAALALAGLRLEFNPTIAAPTPPRAAW
jgi:hypothetical protein